MSNNVTYSFTSQSEQNPSTLVFRSTVHSYGLNHVTDKDISSFYTSFSGLSYFDTGLLPVDGTGMLSIRSAGPHTQIAYQHAPGMYYINWGSYEGDPGAGKFYVAQPYRIIIADIYNNNLLGARTFYSPYPITHPNAQLYHVNLPNINCRGYRGNSVGWICLYHNEDISSYPFNEKVAKIIDRCSGTESYNDQNMSETDGPRFYQSHDKPDHLWDPHEWQNYSEENGFAWTLDPDLWIPILVQDMDNQEKHTDNGEPLTFLMAILGNYQCYYTDPIIPKPVNALTRSDLTVTSDTIFNWFKQSYNHSTSSPYSSNPYTDSLKVRDANSLKTAHTLNFDDHEDEEEDDGKSPCERCQDLFYEDDLTSIYGGDIYCISCLEGYTVWVEHINNYVDTDNPYLHFTLHNESYYLLTSWNYTQTCTNCETIHVYDPDQDYYLHHLNIWSYYDSDNNLVEVCSHCASHDALQAYNEDGFVSNYSPCSECSVYVPFNPDKFSDDFFNVKLKKIHSLNKAVAVCNTCYHHNLTATDRNFEYDYNHLYCSCGREVTLSSMFSAPVAITHLNSSHQVFPHLFKTKLVTNLDAFSENDLENIIQRSHDHFQEYSSNPNASTTLKFILEKMIVNITHFCNECNDAQAINQNYYNNIAYNLPNTLYSFIEDGRSLDSIYGLTLCLSSNH